MYRAGLLVAGLDQERVLGRLISKVRYHKLGSLTAEWSWMRVTVGLPGLREPKTSEGM